MSSFAVQAEPGPPPSHPASAAPGDELAPAYDASPRQRGSLTVWFTDEAIAAWAAEPRMTCGGQPWYSPLAILTALTLRAVFRLAYRQAEGLIGSIVGLLGLKMQWTRRDAHLLLQTRTCALDGTLRPLFERWHPGLANDNPASAGQVAAA